MKEQYKFGTAINCIDGRTQQPVIDYIKQNYAVDMVDMITFPGANGMEFSQMNCALWKHHLQNIQHPYLLRNTTHGS